MDPADVIALFQTPEVLLRKCYLHIAGGATRSPTLKDAPLPPKNGQAQVATFTVQIGDTKTTGQTSSGKQKDRVFVKLTKLSGPANLTDPKTQINVYYIPMVQTSDIGAGQSHYTLPSNGGPDIMLTSKLSGCLFGVGSDSGGALLVSHVQANTAIGTSDPAGVKQRQSDLAANVWQGFQGLVTSQAQMGYEYQQGAAVIGTRSGTTQSFYCQAVGYADSAYTINKVTRIA